MHNTLFITGAAMLQKVKALLVIALAVAAAAVYFWYMGPCALFYLYC